MRIQNAFRLGFVATLGVGAGLLVLGSIVSLQTVFVYIGAALFAALGLDPIVSGLAKRGMPRWAALLTVVVGLLGVLALLVWIVVPVIVDQISRLVNLLPVVALYLQDNNVVEELQRQLPFLDIDALFAELTNFLSTPTNITSIAGGILQAAFVIGTGAFGALIILILTLYFTASLPTMKRGLYQLVPASRRERFADLAEQISQSVGRYVTGQATIGVINGSLSFIFLSIIGAPFPAVLACIAFFFSLIPLVGTLTGSIIIVLLCLVPGLGAPTTAIIAGIYYLVYMQVEAYLLSPNIMRRAVKVPGAVVVIAALAGGILLNILGALIAIPTAAAVILIVRQVLIPRQNAL